MKHNWKDRMAVNKEAKKRNVPFIVVLDEWKLLAPKKAPKDVKEAVLVIEEVPEPVLVEEPEKFTDYINVPPFLRLRIYRLFKEIPMEESLHAIEVCRCKAIEDPEGFAKEYGMELAMLLIQI